MNFRLSQNRRTLIVVFITLLILCETVAYVTITPNPTEQFFQLYLLGAKHIASDYYPDDDSNLKILVPITWYLGVTDDMGSVQFVSVRLKISNQTIDPPDDKQALESPAPILADFPRFLQDNQTWELPLVWRISNATISNGTTRILTVQINNETYQISDWSARKGYNFRLIFELWTWQTDSNTFEFGWTTNNEHRVAWLQVWFNITNLGPPVSPQ